MIRNQVENLLSNESILSFVCEIWGDRFIYVIELITFLDLNGIKNLLSPLNLNSEYIIIEGDVNLNKSLEENYFKLNIIDIR